VTDSQPPPSSQEIPGVSSGVGFYIAGIVILAALTAGLLYLRFRDTGPQTAASIAFVTAAPSPSPLAPLHALPPPPPDDTASATARVSSGKPPASASAATSASAAPVDAPQKSVCAACGEGQGSSALTSAMQSTAEGARGCYKRALRSSQVSGSITVSVRVGSNGSVCGASITNDTVGSSEIASCVLGKFQGRTFPAPQSGCVVVNIPLKFEIQP
jgi:hypothetical protein